MNIKCPKCEKRQKRVKKKTRVGNLMQLVTVIVETPLGNTNLNKVGLRNKKVRVWGVNWDKATIFCDWCGFTLLAGRGDPMDVQERKPSAIGEQEVSHGNKRRSPSSKVKD